MSDNFNTRSTEETTETWLTPHWLIPALGHFDLDPCVPDNMPWSTARYMNKKSMVCGLEMQWPKDWRVWLNPPYGRETFKWMDKLSRHAGGGIALIFARTDTNGFHDKIFERAHSLYFLRGRLKFWHMRDGKYQEGLAGSNAASVLVAYTQADSAAITQAEDAGFIIGKQVFL